jgi:hypothetical protein
MASSPDVLYYNITIQTENIFTSGKTTGADAQSTDASITALNNIPVLDTPDQYYGSIVRFSVPCFTVPTIAFTVQTPILTAQDLNKGIGSFTFKYGNTTSLQSFHIFKPQIEDAQLPKYPSATQDFSTYYYFIYSYVWLMDIYNTALKVAFADLQAQEQGLATAVCPFFYYNPNTQLITLYADKLFFDNSLPTPIYLFFNNISQQWYNGLNYNLQDVGSANGCDCYFIISNQNNLNTQTINAVDYLTNIQDFVSLAYLSPLKNIVITSSMNVISEVFFVNQQSAIQNQSFINVLTDFIPDLSGGQEAGVSSKIFIYNANSLYRVFQFRDITPLYTINMGISWVDQLGNFYPLSLVKGTQATMKIMFIKKTVYNNLTQMGSQVLPRGITYNVTTTSREDRIAEQQKQRDEPLPYGKQSRRAKQSPPSIQF